MAGARRVQIARPLRLRQRSTHPTPQCGDWISEGSDEAVFATPAFAGRATSPAYPYCAHDSNLLAIPPIARSTTALSRDFGVPGRGFPQAWAPRPKLETAVPARQPAGSDRH